MTDPVTREVQLRQDAGRGADAASALASPILLDAFAELSKEALARWENSPVDRLPASVAMREEAFFDLKGLGALMGKLKSWAETGRKARESLQQIETTRKAEQQRQQRRR